MLIQSASVPIEFLGFRRLVPVCEHETLGFLDIETTGLNRRKDPIILVGLMILGPEGGTLHQYFAQNLHEEKEMLCALMNQMMADIPLFTYNGRAFDIPYINQRLQHHGIASRIPPECCVDLLHWAKAAVPDSPRHTLKTMEKHLGIHRKDTLSGADCVEQYRQYLNNPDPQLAMAICRHNYEDILHMAPLLQLYDLLPLSSPLRSLPLSLLLGSDHFWVDRPSLKNGFLSIKGSRPHRSGQRLINYAGSASLQLGEGILEASLPVVVFPHPEPESLYIDSDRIPGYMPAPFNQLSLQDKLKMLIRSGHRYIPENLSSCICRLMQP